jgi:uncharacterized tellurite resistance protein B-like protein
MEQGQKPPLPYRPMLQAPSLMLYKLTNNAINKKNQRRTTMNKRAAILTLLNVTAMADGKVTEEEKQMIFEVLEKELDCSEEEIERGLEENTRLLKENISNMIKEAILVLRNECTVNEMKKIIKLVKEMTMADKQLDKREMLIVELLTQLTA